MQESALIEPSGQKDLSDLSIVLISPNISEEMGGETIKALQIHLSMVRCGVQVHQITHERVRREIETKWPKMEVSYVRDTWLQKTAFRLGQLNEVLGLMSGAIIAIAFQYRAAQIARALLANNPRRSLVHFTSPISPAMPYFGIPQAKVVIGPLNGNIYYPPAFRTSEPRADRIRQRLLSSLQVIQRFAFDAKRRATLLVAGGERTRAALRLAGCKDSQFVASLDSGVPDDLFAIERITHSTRNYRFVHIGRLVKFKGTDLAIRSLIHTRNPVTLDIIGRGPELVALRQLVASLALSDRVNFRDWIPNHELAINLKHFRGLLLPSLAEANGIIVQEAMVLGLPVIALNWGGPSLLISQETGVLIDPNSEEYVIEQLAMAADRLAENGALAERLSLAARESATANGFMWSSLIQQWAAVYRQLLMDGGAVTPS